MNWIYYLLEANLYLAVFYLLYYLLFSNDTHHQWNRLYLLGSCITAFLLPLMQIGALQPKEEIGFIIRTPDAHVVKGHMAYPEFTLQNILFYGYFIGATVMFLVLLYKIWRLLALIRSAPYIAGANYKLMTLEGTDTAFSFFNYLFIGTSLSGSETIIRHELVHIKGKHSFDVIFIEFIKIISWFNPFIYLLQVSIKTQHEFIADEQTAAYEDDAVSYAAFLVNNAYGLSGSSVTHSFFNYNLLKRRIIMLNQKRSGSLARLKYLTALPVFAALLCLSTLGFTKSYGWLDLAPGRYTTGHRASSTAQSVMLRDTVSHITSKGYKFEETGYLINNKTNYRVIITEKNGEQRSWFKNSASTAQLAMLKEKYGYKFPDVMIYPKLPPPPPAPAPQPASITKRPPPPPPAPPKNAEQPSVTKRPPPPPPAPPKQPGMAATQINDVLVPPVAGKADTLNITLSAPPAGGKN